MSTISLQTVQSVKQAIQLHRESVVADEAWFDDNGNPVDAAQAEKTRAAEIAAFRKFCETACSDDADVQAKVEYVLNGTIGLRDTLLSCLHDEDYGGLATQDIFVRSLLVGAN